MKDHTIIRVHKMVTKITDCTDFIILKNWANLTLTIYQQWLELGFLSIRHINLVSRHNHLWQQRFFLPPIISIKTCKHIKQFYMCCAIWFSLNGDLFQPIKEAKNKALWQWNVFLKHYRTFLTLGLLPCRYERCVAQRTHRESSLSAGTD